MPKSNTQECICLFIQLYLTLFFSCKLTLLCSLSENQTLSALFSYSHSAFLPSSCWLLILTLLLPTVLYLIILSISKLSFWELPNLPTHHLNVGPWCCFVEIFPVWSLSFLLAPHTSSCKFNPLCSGRQNILWNGWTRTQLKRGTK